MLKPHTEILDATVAVPATLPLIPLSALIITNPSSSPALYAFNSQTLIVTPRLWEPNPNPHPNKIVLNLTLTLTVTSKHLTLT